MGLNPIPNVNRHIYQMHRRKEKFNFPEKYDTQEVTAKIHTNLDSIP